MNLNNRIAKLMPNETRGALLIKDREYWRRHAQALMNLGIALAQCPHKVSEVIEHLRENMEDPPNAGQQLTLSAMSALAMCQLSMRDALNANDRLNAAEKEPDNG